MDTLTLVAPGLLTFDGLPGCEPLPPRPEPHYVPPTAPEPGILRTTAEVAAGFACQPRSILAVARRKGIKPARVIGGTNMWDSAQVLDLQPLPRGWPKGKKRGAQP